jgi:hypothetical protein
MKVARLSAPRTGCRYFLETPQGQNVAGVNIPDDTNGGRTHDLRLEAQCLNQLRHQLTHRSSKYKQYNAESVTRNLCKRENVFARDKFY